MLKLDSGTLIQFSSDGRNSSSVEIKVDIDDTTYKGQLWTEQVLEDEWGEYQLKNNRRNLIKEINRLKRQGLSELSKKYDLSEDSILTLITYEYYARTGRQINY